MQELATVAVMFLVMALTYRYLSGRPLFDRRGRTGRQRPSDPVAPLPGNSVLIEAFETLHRRYWPETNLSVDRIAQTLRLRAARTPPSMMAMFVVVIGLMMLGGGWLNEIAITPGYLAFCLVPGVLAMGIMWFGSRKSLTIDLLHRLVDRLEFEQVDDVAVIKHHLNGVFTGYSVKLLTPQGRADRELMQTGRDEAAAQALAQWCRQAMIDKTRRQSSPVVARH